MADSDTVDVAIVGGGMTGLQAALTLGRAVRSVAVIDDGHPRNAPALRLRNFLAAPDESPSGFLRRARDGLAPYDVRLHDDRAEAARADRDGVELVTPSGRAWHARALLLATGLREEPPPVPGAAELWGTGVVACPHCHGWEARGERLALIDEPGAAARTVQRALLISRWTGRLALYANGTELRPEQLAALAAADVEVIRAPVERLEAGPADGAVRTDSEGRTSVPRVWAAGSTTAPALLGIGAAGHGSTVAVAIHSSLTREELGL